MNEKIDLIEIEQKTYLEHEMIDGISEILVGFLLIFSPLFLFSPIFLIFIYIPVFFAGPLVNFIRERTTYPRIGRVEFKTDQDKEDFSVKRSILVFLLFMLVTALIAIIMMVIVEGKILNISSLYKWAPLWFGLVMFGPSLILVEKTGRRHYYFFGIFTTLLGFIFSLIAFPDVMDGMILFFFVLGIFLLIFGIIKHIRFIQTYPVIHIKEE